MNQPAIDRIKAHIAQLENPHTSQTHRFMYWRLIIDAAHEAHAAEMQCLDEMKATTPQTVAAGGA
jgi:hypothetical protein